MSIKLEIWRKPLPIHEIHEDYEIEVSNFGRLRRQLENGEYGNVPTNKLYGHDAISIRKKDGKLTTRYLHRFVAELYVEKPSEKHEFVININHDKDNNHYKNIKWVTLKELKEHQEKDPNNKQRTIESKIVNRKLTDAQVIRLKTRLFDPKRKTRMKMLAKEFGISEMQLYRIKVGIHWGHIRVKNEPIHKPKK